ncbi:unnamed protein product [Brachionus calyciflorus]|uniref:Uncharacterized protein n=1 Tax=Brachionus calyciflorus TaxID=104777 RepID=A0A813TAF9_9BILA|nr:unnamed protein product [Brachionus calyciflorus]
MEHSDIRKNYFLNNQYDLDQQNALRLQQIEAIKLIQVSLDKLTSTTTVQLNPNPSNSNSPKSNTVLVYKENNLHKNLLVNKILNKAKFLYYQGVVQTMRLSLMSKLNYYSNLIQQLNNSNSENESSLVDEMKLLMQQILHETYQFNLANNAHSTPVVDLANLFSPHQQTDPNNSLTDNKSQNDQTKRIKQLNDLKMSLYSLLFNQTQNVELKQKVTSKRTSHDLDDEDENLNVDDDDHCVTNNNKKCKINDITNNEDTLDLNNNQILNDETNKRNNKKLKFKSKSTSSKILNIECLV